MADLDLLSYERDSRWMPHLSWAYPDCTLQQRMEAQVAQREQAWQKIADKLGPLLIGTNICSSFGQSDFITRDIDEDEEYLARAYEKAPLLASPRNGRGSGGSNGGGGGANGSSSSASNYRCQSKSYTQSQSFRPSQSFIPSQSYTQTQTTTTSQSMTPTHTPHVVRTPPRTQARESISADRHRDHCADGASESGQEARNASNIVKTIWSGAAQSLWNFIYLIKNAFCASLQRETSLA